MSDEAQQSGAGGDGMGRIQARTASLSSTGPGTFCDLVAGGCTLAVCRIRRQRRRRTVRAPCIDIERAGRPAGGHQQPVAPGAAEAHIGAAPRQGDGPIGAPPGANIVTPSRSGEPMPRPHLRLPSISEHIPSRIPPGPQRRHSHKIPKIHIVFAILHTNYSHLYLYKQWLSCLPRISMRSNSELP